MATTRFLGIDLGDSGIKVGEFVATDGNLTLVKFGKAALEVDSSAEKGQNAAVSNALRKVMSENHFTTRKVGLSVSGQTVLTRFMKVPVADEAKVRQMVRYEAEQNVPFPMDEVVWDFQVIGARDESDLEVAMVAIKKEIIEGFNHCIEEAGLSLVVVDVASLAIYNSVLYNYPVEADGGSLLVLDIGSRTTNLIFVEPKKIFTRSIPIAGNTITQYVCQELEVPFAEAEKLKFEHGFVGLGGAYEEPELEVAAKLSKIIRNVMTRLHAEVSRSISFYKTQQGGRAPQRLLLAGGTSVLPYTDFFFQEKMEIDVEYLNPFQSVRVEVPFEELEKVAHSMGEVVGLGLRLVTECPIEINLLPPTIIQRRQFNRKIPYFAVALAGVIMLLLSWWLYYWKVTDILKKHLDKVSGQVTILRQDNDELTQVVTEQKEIRRQMNQVIEVQKMRRWWIEFLDDLNQRMPRMVWIVQMTPESGGSVAWTGSGTAARVEAPRAPTRRPMFRRNDPGMMEEGGPPGFPPPPGGEGGPPPAETPAAAPTGQKMIDGFELQGLSLNDWESSDPLKPVSTFSESLMKSRFIKEAKIVEPGFPREGDWTFTFKIRIKLKDPIPF
jgi:type IV pilus assembly protein PilM